MDVTQASAMDATQQPSMPVMPAPADTKPLDTIAAGPPPPDTQPVDAPPQTMPVTTPEPMSDAVATPTQVPNLMADTKSKEEAQVFYRIRLGYDRTQYGRGSDAWHVGAQFNVRPAAWPGESSSKLATFLVPDTTVDIAHTGLATTINKAPTTGDGVQADLNLYWPWLNWGLDSASGEPGADNAPAKYKLSLGPTTDLAYQELTSTDSARAEWIRYAGTRIMLNHDAFVEYTIGRTDGLPGWRQQSTAEFPIYQKTGSDLRYVIRGSWNSAYDSSKDLYGISVLIEIPLDTFNHPSKFLDLVPFAN